MFKIKAADGTNNLCGRRIAEVRKSKKLSQRKLAVRMQLLGFDVDHFYPPGRKRRTVRNRY